MPTEVEELKLRITLDDQASAQLSNIRQQLTQMGSGPVGQGLQNITAKSTEAEKAMVRLTRAQLGVTHGMTDIAKVAGPWAGALSLAVVGITKHMAAMKEWAASGQQLANSARMAGTNVASLRALQEGFATAGIGAQQTAEMMQRMQAAIAEAARPGSAVREQLLKLGGREFQANMANAIDKLSHMRDIIDRSNYLRHVALNVYAAKLKATHGDQAAAREAQLHFLRVFGAEQLANAREVAHYSQQKSDNIEAENAQQQKLNDLLVTEEQTRGRIWEIIKASMAGPTSAVVKPLVSLEKLAAEDLERGEAGRRANPNAPRFYNPNVDKGFLQGGVPGFQHGGIVTQPTMGMIGEAGPEAIIPLDQMEESKHTESVGENTKQLRMLNDQMERMLNPSMISRYAGGMGGLGSLGAGPGGVGAGPGGTSSATGPSTGPAPGTPGGPAISMESARLGMKPTWDDKRFASPYNNPTTWGQAAQRGGGLTTGGFAGAPRMPWPAQSTVDAGISGLAGSGGGSPGGRTTRGDRNKNPGNIKKGRESEAFGAVGYDEQGHAIFPTWEAGNAAQAAMLKRIYGGQTIAQMGRRYAEDPHWAAGVMRFGNYGPNDIPDMSTPEGMERLQAAIRRQEGTHVPEDVIARAKTGTAPPAQIASLGPFGIGSTEASGLGAARPGDQYTGVGEYNFAGSARAHAMGIDIGASQVQKFPTGLPKGVGPAEITANKYAGPDFVQFLQDLHEAGAPLTDFSGVYNYREKRGGGGLSQHAYGNAMDIETGAGAGPSNSPALWRWAQANPEKFAAIQAAHHLRNLDTTSGARMHDWGHFEWTPTGLAKPGETQLAGPMPAPGAPVSAWPTGTTLDRMMGGEVQKHDVNTSGTIRIKHDRKTRGSVLTHRPSFKDMPDSRQTQMLPANDGPRLGDNPASGV